MASFGKNHMCILVAVVVRNAEKRNLLPQEK